MGTEGQSPDSFVRVKLFAGLRDVFGRGEICVPAVRAPDAARLLEALSDTPERRRHLLHESGAVREGLVFLLNGRNIGLPAGVTAELSAGDEVALFPPVGGG